MCSIKLTEMNKYGNNFQETSARINLTGYFSAHSEIAVEIRLSSHKYLRKLIRLSYAYKHVCGCSMYSKAYAFLMHGWLKVAEL